MWNAPHCSATSALLDESGTAVHESGDLGAVRDRAAGHRLDVGFVGLAEVCGVRAGHSALLSHPGDGHGGVEPSGECDADALADGKGGEDLGHAYDFRASRCPASTAAASAPVRGHLRRMPASARAADSEDRESAFVRGTSGVRRNPSPRPGSRRFAKLSDPHSGGCACAPGRGTLFSDPLSSRQHPGEVVKPESTTSHRRVVLCCRRQSTSSSGRAFRPAGKPVR